MVFVQVNGAGTFTVFQVVVSVLLRRVSDDPVGWLHCLRIGRQNGPGADKEWSFELNKKHFGKPGFFYSSAQQKISCLLSALYTTNLREQLSFFCSVFPLYYIF
jgi:hypothetical protein